MIEGHDEQANGAEDPSAQGQPRIEPTLAPQVESEGTETNWRELIDEEPRVSSERRVEVAAPPSRNWMVAAAAAIAAMALVIVVLVAMNASSGSNRGGFANLGQGGSGFGLNGPGSAQSKSFETCMQRHGVTLTPGSLPSASQRTTIKKAFEACRSTLPSGGKGSLPGGGPPQGGFGSGSGGYGPGSGGYGPPGSFGGTGAPTSSGSQLQ